MEQRWPGDGVDRLAGGRSADPRDRSLHGRDLLVDAHSGRYLLLGIEARWPLVGLVHRVDEPGRIGGRGGVGGLRLRLVCLLHHRPVRLELRRIQSQNIFIIYIIVLVCHVFINLFPSHILSYWNNGSAYWHIVGAAVIVLILIFAPDSHQSPSFVFTQWVNNSGFDGGSTSSLKFFLYVVPLGVILTQYTITGFDASAHLSEETTGAAKAAAQGMWRSVFYSWIFGWILLLCFLFAVKDVNGSHFRLRRRLVDRHLRRSIGPWGIQSRDDHLHHRPVLLRRLGDDQRFTHDVCVQSRPSAPRASAVVEGGAQPRPPKRHTGHGDHLPDRRLAGPVRQPGKHPDRVLRAGIGDGGGPLHRLLDSDLLEVAHGFGVPGRTVDAREQATSGCVRWRWSR